MSNTNKYQARTIELEEEYISVGRRLLPIKVRTSSRVAALAGSTKTRFIYACLFNAASVTLQDSLFLLQAEVNEYCATSRIPHILVIGVRDDWMDYTHKSTKRFLWIDENGICNDTVVDEPVAIDFVHFVHFENGSEIKTHKRLTNLLMDSGVVLVNPAGTLCDICNSKYKTFKKLIAANIRTPETLFISKFSLPCTNEVTERIKLFIHKLKHNYPVKNNFLLFVQPDTGTEAEETFAVRLSADGNFKDHLLVTEICRRNRDVVVRLAHGNLFYAGFVSGCQPARFVVRINSFENMSVGDLSGYAIVGHGTEQQVVAISRGAQKVGLYSALRCLSNQEGRRIDIATTLQGGLYHTARQVYQAINSGSDINNRLSLLGIDVVLEMFDDRVCAIVIDVNARPVIAHSTFKTKREDKLGLGIAYWQTLSYRATIGPG